MELHKPQCCFVLILHRYSKTAHAKTRAKSRMALNNHRQLHALATLVQIYCKIRRLVQEARHSGSSVDTLVGRLMTRCCERDALVLGEIARRLQMKKRLRQPWGNLSKKDDRLYKCLAKSVNIKNLRDNSAINDFVRESFRCRAIAVVERLPWYQHDLAGVVFCLRAQSRPRYSLTGSTATRTNYRARNISAGARSI